MRAKYPATVKSPLRQVASKRARCTEPILAVAHRTKRCGGMARSRRLLARWCAQSALLIVMVRTFPLCPGPMPGLWGREI